jgi:Amt family ammonium transporter
MVAVFNTNTAASTGVLGWTLVDYIRNGRKFSAVGACEGAIAGLVGITPAAGYVSLWLAAAIGFITAVVCALLHNINGWLHIDEGMEVFKIHGIGGMVGSLLTGIFASSSVSSLDGATIASGAIDGVGIQVVKQLAEIGAISGYSFVVSCILLYAIKVIPGMALRVSEETELNGLDNHKFFDEQIGDRHIHDAVLEVVQSTRSSFPGTPRSEELSLLKPTQASEFPAMSRRDSHIHGDVLEVVQSTRNPIPGTPRSEESSLLKPTQASEFPAMPRPRFA